MSENIEAINPPPVETSSTEEDTGSGPRTTGVVKWFSNAKGYGFLETQTGTPNEDIFVHYRAINSTGFRTLRQGQSVEFTLARGDKGYQAEEVVVLAGFDSNSAN